MQHKSALAITNERLELW